MSTSSRLSAYSPAAPLSDIAELCEFLFISAGLPTAFNSWMRVDDYLRGILAWSIISLTGEFWTSYAVFIERTFLPPAPFLPFPDLVVFLPATML